MLVHDGSTSPMTWTSELMEVSVAPPMLTTVASGKCARTRSGRSTGIQSPVSTTSRSAGGAGVPVSSSQDSSIPISAGTVCQTETPCRRIASAQCAGSPARSAAGSTSAPPTASGPKTSYTERSKLSDDRPMVRSAGPTSNRRSISRTVSATPPCSIITPLGTPVEPEVKMT